MPVYDMKCPQCNHKVDDVFLHKHDDKIKCKRCGAILKRLISRSSRFIGVNCFPNEGVFLEHVCPEGRRFHSKKEMQDFEKKTGTMIGMLH